MSIEYANFRILDQHVLVQFSSSDLGHALTHPLHVFAFSPPVSADPDLILSVTARPDSGLYDVACEGRVVGKATNVAHCFRLMEWQLDMFLSSVVTDRLLLHAGAVARNGVSIIFPGTSGSGKSSLTLALLLAGYDYLSDELAVIDATTTHVSAFPKPLSIKNRGLFATTIPQHWFGPDTDEITVARQQQPDYQPVWYIHPHDLDMTIYQGGLPARFIIFPKYMPGSVPHLTPLDANDTLQLLIENSVNFPQFAGRSLNVLSRFVANATGYRLESGDLDGSVRLVNELMEAVG